MANFINYQAPKNWKPQIGELVIGRSGKREFKGYVLESTKKKGKPAIFNRWGAVLCWIETEAGTKKAVNELRPGY